jgi:hypothetical protein
MFKYEFDLNNNNINNFLPIKEYGIFIVFVYGSSSTGIIVTSSFSNIPFSSLKFYFSCFLCILSYFELGDDW